MIHYNITNKSAQRSAVKFKILLGLIVLSSLFSLQTHAQVSASVDSTSVQIGGQITYKLKVETDTTNLVVFPESKTFGALEVIESYPVDTIKNNAIYRLEKAYGLIQFDSGAYTIPRQKIIIGTKTVFTDSLNVEVRNIAVDTAKQKLYDIKPIIEVDKTGAGNWWKYLLYAVLAIAGVAALLWWFIWRQKPLTEDEKVALLPPYDRAKLALKKLDESDYLEHEELKDYYSELTLIIRKYLNEKVYDRALESTTNELVHQLQILKQGNKIDLSPETIKNIENILKRADLVKFAKSAPDIALAEIDRSTIDAEIDHVKEVLPEPTEEEKLLDEKYKEQQERKKRNKKILLTVGISVFILIATVVGLSFKYGFDNVKDTVIGHESKALLEGEWVTSAYGIPPITITTPKVLKRTKSPLPEEILKNIDQTLFTYGSLLGGFNVAVTTTKIKNAGENKIQMELVADQTIKLFEQQGVENIMVKNEKFTTPKGAEGIKLFGTGDFPSLVQGEKYKGKYAVLIFVAEDENVIQQVVINAKEEDAYAEKIIERILNSVELKNDED